MLNVNTWSTRPTMPHNPSHNGTKYSGETSRIPWKRNASRWFAKRLMREQFGELLGMNLSSLRRTINADTDLFSFHVLHHSKGKNVILFGESGAKLYQRLIWSCTGYSISHETGTSFYAGLFCPAFWYRLCGMHVIFCPYSSGLVHWNWGTSEIT